MKFNYILNKLKTFKITFIKIKNVFAIINELNKLFVLI